MLTSRLSKEVKDIFYTQVDRLDLRINIAVLLGASNASLYMAAKPILSASRFTHLLCIVTDESDQIVPLSMMEIANLVKSEFSGNDRPDGVLYQGGALGENHLPYRVPFLLH